MATTDTTLWPRSLPLGSFFFFPGIPKRASPDSANGPCLRTIKLSCFRFDGTAPRFSLIVRAKSPDLPRPIRGCPHPFSPTSLPSSQDFEGRAVSLPRKGARPSGIEKVAETLLWFTDRVPQKSRRVEGNSRYRSRPGSTYGDLEAQGTRRTAHGAA